MNPYVRQQVAEHTKLDRQNNSTPVNWSLYLSGDSGMAQIIIVTPFAVTYDGNDAEQNVINAQSLGESIIGASKLYTAVTHFCVFGNIPRGNYKKEFNCYATPPVKGSYEYQMLLAAISNEWALHGDIYKEGLKYLFPRIIDAIKKIWLKPSETVKVTEMLIDFINEQAKRDDSLKTLLVNGLIRSNDNLASLHGKLIDAMPQISESTRSNGRMLVTPVGNSCTSLSQFSKTGDEITISEPEAEVIRGGNEMEIEEMQNFKCKRIREVNELNGHCILEVEGFDEFIVGKINDPALQMPNNVYTKSLDNHTAFTISAKPVKRNGVVQKLYISDARDNMSRT